MYFPDADLYRKKMAIWSKPSDKDYRGPCTYRLIVKKQNYCGKTFRFRPRMNEHKSDAKLWRERSEKGEHVLLVSETIDNNWDKVIIEIIARYPDKIKGVEADELFMNEREIEAIAFYDSFNNGLNVHKGGASGGRNWSEEAKSSLRKRMIGNTYGVGHKRSKVSISAQIKRQNKPVKATWGDKSWDFESSTIAAEILANELGKTFDKSSIAKAARGVYGMKKNLSIYKGVTFCSLQENEQ